MDDVWTAYGRRLDGVWALYGHCMDSVLVRAFLRLPVAGSMGITDKTNARKDKEIIVISLLFLC